MDADDPKEQRRQQIENAKNQSQVLMESDIKIEYLDMLARYGMKGMSVMYNISEYMEESVRKHALLALRKFREAEASFYILEGALDTLHDLASRNVELVVYKGKVVNTEFVMNWEFLKRPMR